MTVDVFAADEQTEVEVDVERWLALARQVLDAQGIKLDTEVSLLFVDEPTITELNEQFLGRKGPTDVLAFPIDDEPEPGGRSPDGGGNGPGGGAPETEQPPMLLGDVVICPAVAGRNASERDVDADDEIALLVVHGLLHLIGMDHVEEAEALAMERRERELLERFHRSAS